MSEINTLFGEDNDANSEIAGTRTGSEMKPGQIQGAREREAAAEEARRRAEEEARKKAEEEEAKKAAEEEERKRNSTRGKIKRGFLDFFNKMISPEE